MIKNRSVRNTKATIVDINRDIKLPDLNMKKKNKNDYYRFLLSSNRGERGMMSNTNIDKINNDVFIPRSILKKSNFPGSIKEQRLEAAAEEFFEYQLAMNQMKKEIGDEEEYLGKYEVIFGQHLDITNPLLSPKVKTLLNEKVDIEQILQYKQSTDRAQNAVSDDMTVPIQNLNVEDGHDQNNDEHEITTRVNVEGSQQATTPEDQLNAQGSDGASVSKIDKSQVDGDEQDSEKPPSTHTRKLKIRQAIKDKGVFETGVEVVEHEIELDEDDDGRVQAMRLFNDGKLTHKQMKELLMR